MENRINEKRDGKEKGWWRRGQGGMETVWWRRGQGWMVKGVKAAWGAQYILG